MKEGLLLTVLASVVAVEGGQARLDRGLLDGLLVGDRGRVFYRLRVGDVPRDILGGEVEVGRLGKSESWVDVPSTVQVRPGYSVRFEVPGDRIAPRSLLAAARDLGMNEAEFRQIVGEILGGALDTEDQEVLSLLRELVAEPEPSPPVDMILVPGGAYPIGLDLGEAEFFNEHPRFFRELSSFWVDRAVIGPEVLARPTFDQALSYCRERGKRLLTEFEWEVALGLGEVEPGPRLEWTASWYRPYPGNPMNEKEYDGGFRVVRGGSRDGGFSPHRRRFMAPAGGHPDVGFRCARSTAPEEAL